MLIKVIWHYRDFVPHGQHESKIPRELADLMFLQATDYTHPVRVARDNHQPFLIEDKDGNAYMCYQSDFSGKIMALDYLSVSNNDIQIIKEFEHHKISPAYISPALSNRTKLFLIQMGLIQQDDPRISMEG